MRTESKEARLLLLLGGVGALLGGLVYWRRRTRLNGVLLVLFVVAVLTIASLNWNSRKPFLNDASQIAPGMTVAQVDHLMAGYMRRPQRVGSLGPQQTISYRHTNAAWGDADVVAVWFDEAGRVSRVSVLLD